MEIAEKPIGSREGRSRWISPGNLGGGGFICQDRPSTRVHTLARVVGIRYLTNRETPARSTISKMNLGDGSGDGILHGCVRIRYKLGVSYLVGGPFAAIIQLGDIISVVIRASFRGSGGIRSAPELPDG